MSSSRFILLRFFPDIFSEEEQAQSPAARMSRKRSQEDYIDTDSQHIRQERARNHAVPEARSEAHGTVRTVPKIALYSERIFLWKSGNTSPVRLVIAVCCILLFPGAYH